MNRTSSLENSHADFTELDRLVTQEINILKQQGKKHHHIKDKQNNDVRRSGSVISKDDRAKNIPSTKASLHQQEPFFPDDLDSLDVEKDGAIISDDNQQLGKTSETEFFSEDELAFIERSTAWLESRENKDLIISRIWDQLTEITPENFYSADLEHSSEIDNTGEDVESGRSDENVDTDSQNLSD